MTQTIDDIELRTVIARTFSLWGKVWLPTTLVAFVSAILLPPVFIGASNFYRYGVVLSERTLFLLDQPVYWLVSALLGVPSTILTTRICLDRMRGTPSSAEEHLDDFRRHFIPIFLIWLVFAPVYVASMMMPRVPALLVSVAWSVLTAVLAVAETVRVAENESVIGSLRRSAQLFRGNLRLAIGFALAWEFLSWGSTLIFTPDLFSAVSVYRPQVFWFFDPVADTLASVLVTIACVVVYAELRAAREGGLESTVAQVFD